MTQGFGVYSCWSYPGVNMRTTKVIGLGIFFSFVGFVMLLVISIMRRGLGVGVGVEPSHATGLSALSAAGFVVGMGFARGLCPPVGVCLIVHSVPRRQLNVSRNLYLYPFV